MRPGKVHRFAARQIQRLTPGLRCIENKIIADQPPGSPSQPILFIVGAPRSGTTLAFQCLSHALDVIYPSHLATLFPLTPAFGLWLSDLVYGGRPHHSFRSVLGFSIGDGLLGPNEWEVLFRERIISKFSCTARSTLELSNFPELERIAKYMHRASPKPMIVKVPLAVLHIDVIGRLLPTSKFLYIKRQPLDIARSIYRAKRSEGKGAHVMWYIRPHRVWNQHFPTEAHQIATQIREIDRLVTESFALLDPIRRESLEYEELCRSPVKEIARIEDWLGTAQKRSGAALPSFTPTRSLPLADAALDEILRDELGGPTLRRPGLMSGFGETN